MRSDKTDEWNEVKIYFSARKPTTIDETNLVEATSVADKPDLGINGHFIRIGNENEIYAVDEEIGSGSKGVIKQIQDAKGNVFVLKLAEFEQLVFPDIPNKAFDEFDSLKDQLQYMSDHKAVSSEEIILKQLGLLKDSAYIKAEDSSDPDDPDWELAVVMPHLGTSFKKYLTDHKHSDAELLRYALQCINHLEKLHDGSLFPNTAKRYFIHGDVSISNFLIQDKKIHLIDYGRSLPIDDKGEGSVPSTFERSSIDPPEYKKRACSSKSDVYRLADVLKEILPDPLLATDLQKMKAFSPEDRPSLAEIKQTLASELERINSSTPVLTSSPTASKRAA